MTDWQLIAATAEQAAREAGRLLRDKWQQPRQVSHKGFRDLVTDADLEAQQCIRGIVADRFPAHRFLGEEDTQEAINSLLTTGETVWIVDPVDGTSNYSRQVPVFAVSIGIAHEGKVKAGVIYDPMRDELFRAVSGQGVSCQERPLKASEVATPAHAILALDWGHSQPLRARTLRLLNRLAHEVQTMRAIGSAALALAWIAAGRLDAYLNVSLKPWDVAAGGLMIEEAGGRMSLLDGRPWTWQEPSMACLASNQLLHETLFARIAGTVDESPSFLSDA